MTDRIRTLVKRISETRPVQSARREALLSDLRALRGDIDQQTAPEQARSLDAALLLMEFMSRSEDVATADTLQIVASLVGTIDEGVLRIRPAVRARAEEAAPAADVATHQDLRMTQEFLLGNILLQAGLISPDTLGRALQLQASSSMALGQCLVQLGAATAQQIASAIAYQDRLRDEERTTRAEAERGAQIRTDLRLSSKQKGMVQSIHSQVLGEILIRLGTITREQLQCALQVQHAANLHIGEALVETGVASWDQVKKGLDIQRQLRRVG